MEDDGSRGGVSSGRWASRPWLTLLAAALFLTLGLTYRMLHEVFPVAREVLGVLRREWPAVRVRGEHFELVDAAPLRPILLPRGWRVLFDPDEELRGEDVKPGTIVVQQGRFLVRDRGGLLRSFNWSLSPDEDRVVEADLFAKLDRALLIAALIAGGLLFVPSFLVALILAALASGLLLVLELVGVGRAPASSAFGYASLLLLPFAFLYMLSRGSGLHLGRTELTLAVGYLLAVALSWWFESRRPATRHGGA